VRCLGALQVLAACRQCWDDLRRNRYVQSHLPERRQLPGGSVLRVDQYAGMLWSRESGRPAIVRDTLPATCRSGHMSRWSQLLLHLREFEYMRRGQLRLPSAGRGGRNRLCSVRDVQPDLSVRCQLRFQ
jgi:hypothetical protein